MCLWVMKRKCGGSEAGDVSGSASARDGITGKTGEEVRSIRFMDWRKCENARGGRCGGDAGAMREEGDGDRKKY